jgi:hypothetical protein
LNYILFLLLDKKSIDNDINDNVNDDSFIEIVTLSSPLTTTSPSIIDYDFEIEGSKSKTNLNANANANTTTTTNAETAI